MAMMAYKGTMFMVFFNYSMIIANWIGTIIFPNTTIGVGTSDTDVLSAGAFGIFDPFSSTGGLLALGLTAGVLALFAFSLLVPTIPFVAAFFALQGIIAGGYITQLGLPRPNGIPIFEAPILAGIAIVTYMGISQYAARSNFSGS